MRISDWSSDVCSSDLNIALRRRLPQWIVPAAAGAGMLLMAVWLEYSWLERTTTAFPDGVEVASTNQVRSWYRPWTYAVPLTNRLIAVDHCFDRRHAGVPDRVLTRVRPAGRWEPRSAARRVGNEGGSTCKNR